MLTFFQQLCEMWELCWSSTQLNTGGSEVTFAMILWFWENTALDFIPAGICSLHSWGHAHRQPDSSSGLLLPYFRSRPHSQRWRHLLSFSGEQATGRQALLLHSDIHVVWKGWQGDADFTSLTILVFIDHHRCFKSLVSTWNDDILSPAL